MPQTVSFEPVADQEEHVLKFHPQTPLTEEFQDAAQKLLTQLLLLQSALLLHHAPSVHADTVYAQPNQERLSISVLLRCPEKYSSQAD
jgi:hypothetical protein